MCEHFHVHVCVCNVNMWCEHVHAVCACKPVLGGVHGVASTCVCTLADSSSSSPFAEQPHLALISCSPH